LTAPDAATIVGASGNPFLPGKLVMKIRPIVVGMVVSLVLPLAGASARAVYDPGLNRAGAGVDLDRSAAYSAENYGRAGGKGGKGGKGSGGKGSKSPSKPR
jgi:hypothetical protein